MIPAYATIATGSILLLGTLLILMFRRTYVDPATKEPIVFELPIIGKVKTQSPLFLLIVIGAALVVYGENDGQDLAKISAEEGKRFSVTGAIRIVKNSDSSVPVRKDFLVYFIGIPNYQYEQQSTTESNTFTTSLPLVLGMTYRAKYVVDGQVVGDRELKIKNNAADLGEFTYELNQERTREVKPRIEVSDAAKAEFLQK